MSIIRFYYSKAVLYGAVLTTKPVLQRGRFSLVAVLTYLAPFCHEAVWQRAVLAGLPEDVEESVIENVH